jgi:hypothetical protein
VEVEPVREEAGREGGVELPSGDDVEPQPLLIDYPADGRGEESLRGVDDVRTVRE